MQLVKWSIEKIQLHIRIRISFNEHDSVSVPNSQSRESADLFFEKKRCIFIC